MSLQMSPTCPILCNQGNLIDRFQNVLMLGFCFKLSEILTLRFHIAMELFQAILVMSSLQGISEMLGYVMQWRVV